MDADGAPQDDLCGVGRRKEAAPRRASIVFSNHFHYLAKGAGRSRTMGLALVRKAKSVLELVSVFQVCCLSTQKIISGGEKQ